MSYCVSPEIRDQKSFGSIRPLHFTDEENKTFDQSWLAAELEPESGLMSDGLGKGDGKEKSTECFGFYFGSGS